MKFAIRIVVEADSKAAAMETYDLLTRYADRIGETGESSCTEVLEDVIVSNAERSALLD
jgi:hypothetical protein